MPRNNWGPTGKRRAKHLVEALLDYANNYPCNKFPIANLELRWAQEADLPSSSAKLIVQTKLRALEELTKKKGHQLDKIHLVEVIKSLKYLQILTDNRVKKQGKEDWLFTLNLWSHDKNTNLEQLELKWEKYKSNQSKIKSCQDWADAPLKQNFYGRENELADLKQWIIHEQCSVVVIVGMGGVGKTSLSIKLGKGGIGKTDLSLKLAREIQDEFEYVLWRSLRNAPPIECLLLNLLKFLSNQQDIKEDTLEQQLLRLLDCLRSHRCLLILDNVETILQTGQNAQQYRTGYEVYGELFQMFAQSVHQSCLLLTTREKPQNLVRLAGEKKPVRFLELKGLDSLNGLKILRDIGSFSGTEDECQRLIEFYEGNPLALELAAHHIKDSFGSNISAFLKEGKPVFDNLCELLNWHFERLVESEREILYWLAINREPVNRLQLKDDIVAVKNQQNLASTLESLQGKIPLEKNEEQQLFTLQSVLMEFITKKLSEEICQEILTKERDWRVLNNYALMKAQAKDYLKITQIRLILQPIIQSLIEKFQGQRNLENRLRQILKKVQIEAPLVPGYIGGNILNFFNQLKTDLQTSDLSNLTIWQADLQQTQLIEVNLTHSDLSKSIFSQIFSNILTVEISPNGQLLAAGDANGEIHLWDLRDGLQIFSLKGHTNYVNKIKFTSNSTQLASCSSDYNSQIMGYYHRTLP